MVNNSSFSVLCSSNTQGHQPEGKKGLLPSSLYLSVSPASTFYKHFTLELKPKGTTIKQKGILVKSS
jgi:hypothetical protein